MAERIDRRLAERRALLRRIEQHRLEDDDWAVVDALVAELIDQAEPGQESLTIELSEEGEDRGGKTDRDRDAESSRSENPRR